MLIDSKSVVTARLIDDSGALAKARVERLFDALNSTGVRRRFEILGNAGSNRIEIDMTHAGLRVGLTRSGSAGNKRPRRVATTSSVQIAALVRSIRSTSST
ncbi:MAG TPA: hypothetical protein VFN25_00485 [Dokdonella sp.]|uniref:hypothetical protein n=1 Tax=Dokdonella sp. TaxID=2291710 RepID=UPI002D8059AA|nr:hypothetical protein [Dokdonella sp.]HET9031356.1 hypothetical protein [Dokdonella sp.]